MAGRGPGKEGSLPHLDFPYIRRLRSSNRQPALSDWCMASNTSVLHKEHGQRLLSFIAHLISNELVAVACSET